jgi:hypothetical protein
MDRTGKGAHTGVPVNAPPFCQFRNHQDLRSLNSSDLLPSSVLQTLTSLSLY